MPSINHQEYREPEYDPHKALAHSVILRAVDDYRSPHHKHKEECLDFLTGKTEIAVEWFDAAGMPFFTSAQIEKLAKGYRKDTSRKRSQYPNPESDIRKVCAVRGCERKLHPTMNVSGLCDTHGNFWRGYLERLEKNGKAYQPMVRHEDGTFTFLGRKHERRKS